MIRYLTAEKIERLANMILGEALIRDRGLLASAAERPRTFAFGEECYPSLWEKAAVLAHSIIRTHPLVDGNKRLGMEAALVFLRLNEEEPTDDTDAKVNLALDVASGKLDDITDIAARLQVLCGK